MGPTTLLLHLIDFAAPAAGLALAMALAGRSVMPGSNGGIGWWRMMAVRLGAILATMVAGALFTGQDGRMATWAAAVLVAASAEWLLRRGWR